MANKYATGNLFIVYFDEYGTRKNKNLVYNYMDGRKEIKEHLKNNPECSCTLERVIFNSKDTGSYDVE